MPAPNKTRGKDATFDFSAEQLQHEVVADENTRNYLASAVSRQVDARVKEREERRSKIWNLAILVVGLVGLGGIETCISYRVREEVSTFKKDIVSESEIRQEANMLKLESKIQGSVSKTVSSAVVDLQEGLQNQTDYQELAYLAFSLGASDAFTASERDSAVRLLRRVKESGEYASKPGFTAILEQILVSFGQSSQAAQFLRVANLFRDEVLTTPSITTSAMQHFGHKVLGDPRHTDEIPSEYLRWFEDTIRACHSEATGASYIYAMLLEFKRSSESKTDALQRMVGGLEDLGDADRTIADEMLLHLLSPAAGPETAEQRRLVLHFVQSYPAALPSTGALSE